MNYSGRPLHLIKTECRNGLLSKKRLFGDVIQDLGFKQLFLSICYSVYLEWVQTLYLQLILFSQQGISILLANSLLHIINEVLIDHFLTNVKFAKLWNWSEGLHGVKSPCRPTNFNSYGLLSIKKIQWTKYIFHSCAYSKHLRSTCYILMTLSWCCKFLDFFPFLTFEMTKVKIICQFWVQPILLYITSAGPS